MRTLLRIERSGTRPGEYVGHCHGAQRIRRGGLGWTTYALGSSAGTFVHATAPTLEELDRKLETRAAMLESEVAA